MKKNNLILTLATVMSAAAAPMLSAEATPPTFALQDCTVSAVFPENADFFGGIFASRPAAGDKITLDLNSATVTSLEFESGARIPIQEFEVVLAKTSVPESRWITFEGTHKSPTSDYFAALLAKVADDTENSTVTIQVLRKRFEAGSGQMAGQMILHQLNMDCVARAP